MIALILMLKKYKVRGGLGVDMPSNWTALHWGLSRENVEFIIAAAEPKVKHFAKVIIAGEKYFDGLIPLILGLGLMPLSLMYLILGHLLLAKLLFASKKCTGCGVCANLCPKRAITMIDSRPCWGYACDNCMACMNYCPQQAVEASPIMAGVVYYLSTVPAAVYLGDLAGLSPQYWGIIWYIYLLAAVWLAYLFLHTAMGWRLFNMLFSALTHTRYYRRYHAPGVGIKDFNRK